jgi:[acyl-carrier-protein] S-malonyltransferase
VSAMTPSALLFPGQGSLTPDAADHARAAWPELVAQAIELTGRDPFEHAHDSTEFAQPAIFLASIAGWRERELEDVIAMGGHSLGELSALAAAGALSVEDALGLVVLRGRLMQAAADEHPGGGMVALLGGDPTDAERIASEHNLAVANENAPGQLVLSGNGADIRALIPVARERGFKALVLDVPGAFHSPAVAAARAPFLDALRAAPWRAPQVTVVSGLTGAPFTDPAVQLADALVAPVRWRAVMSTLFDLGAREFVDVGPGRVLARLVPRNLPTGIEHALAG